MTTSSSNLPSNAVWFGTGHMLQEPSHSSQVTGCSSGLGRSLASLIASKPSLRLVATARDVSSLSYLPTAAPNVLVLSLDVTSKEAVSVAVEAAISRFGRIDVFVNNAGYFLFGDTEAIEQTALTKRE